MGNENIVSLEVKKLEKIQKRKDKVIGQAFQATLDMLQDLRKEQIEHRIRIEALENKIAKD